MENCVISGKKINFLKSFLNLLNIFYDLFPERPSDITYGFLIGGSNSTVFEGRGFDLEGQNGRGS